MAVTETVKIVFEVDDKQVTDSVTELAKLGKVSQEDAAKFNALTAASKAAGASLEGASKGAEKFAVASKDVAKSTTEVAKSAAELKTVAPSLGQAGQSAEAAGEGFVSLRTRLKEAKDELARLEEEFGAFSPQANEARERAGELADQMSDLNRQVNLLNPESKIQAFSTLGQGIVGAFSVATGALQAFGAENEEVQAIAQRLQGALNIVQGVQSIIQLKEAYQDVKAVLGFTTAAQTALTTATTAGSAATTGAAAATRGFAAALSSTGIGAIVVGLGLLAGAMLLSSDSTDEDTEAQEKNNAERDEAIAKLNEEIDLLEARKEAQDKGVGAAQRELELAKARGAQGKELFDAEQKARQAELQALIGRQAFLGEDFKNEQEKLALAEQIKDKRNQLVAAEIQFQREQREQGVEDFKASEEAKLQALLDNQAAIDAAYSAQQALRQQFEQELASQLGDIDQQANLRRLTNQVQFYDDKQALEEANLLNEIQAADERILKLQEFDKIGTDEYAAELAKRDKLNKDYNKLVIDGKKALLGQEEALALLQNQVNATSGADLAEKNFKTQEEFLLKRIDLEKAGSVEQKKLLAELDLLYKNYEKGKTKTAEDEAAERRQIAAEAAQEAFDFIFELNQQSFQRESEELEKQKEQGLITEEQYQEKLRALKNKQARADKEAAIFNATIQFSQALINALTVTPSTAAPAALALAAAVAGLNLAKIIATPLPKFKKGTLAVPGYDTGDDSVHAMLRPGEAVIPTEINREYASAIKAIYTRKVSSKELNEFVESRSRMTVVQDEPVFNFNPVTMDALFKRDLRVSRISSAVDRASGGIMPTINVKADVDTYALSKVISKNKSMEVTNVESIGEAVAEALSKRTNRRQQI